MEKHGMSATASLGKDTFFTAPHIQNSDRRVEKGVYLCLSSLPAPPFHATEQALNTIRANQLPIRAALRELAFRMDDSAVTEALRVLVHPLIHGGTVREHCRSCQNVLLNDPRERQSVSVSLLGMTRRMARPVSLCVPSSFFLISTAPKHSQPCVVRPLKPPLFLFLRVRKLSSTRTTVGTTQLHLGIPVHIGANGPAEDSVSIRNCGV